VCSIKLPGTDLLSFADNHLQSNDVVLTEITSGLNLNQFQDNLAGFFSR